MAAAAASTFREVSVGLIDEPDDPTRERMDAEALRELADNIASEGLSQPIGLEQRGVRFSIIWGHRRYIAHKMIGAETILARVFHEGCDRAAAMQAGENGFREKVNAADEGKWLQRRFTDECGEDVEKLCALVGMPESYVCSRLVLAQGDPDILAAVKEKKISLTVALELNRIPAPDLRYYYLTNAKETGASAKQARFWRSQAEQIIATRVGNATTPGSDATAVASAPVNENRCACCGATHDVSQMVWIQVHNYCNQAIVEPFLRRRREAES